MKRKSAIIIAVLIMSIGFAAVSTTLIINGSAKVSENTDDFSVIFTKATLDGTDVYASVIDDTKKIINFNTKDLKNIGDTSVLNYEVTNNSANYDAEVTVNCKVKDNTTAKYTSIKNEIEGNATVVKAKETLNGTLTITLNKTATEEVRENYVCELTFNAVERDVLGFTISKPNEPELTDNLIPVIIADNGIVTYADTTREWYNYENKVWANAVILEDGKNYNVGDTISEADIQSYFVWIPRYRYKLFNTDNYSLTTVNSAINVESKAQEIEVEFENKEMAASNGMANGEWLTHPAFTSFDTNGFWVGKFETGYKGATSASAAQVNASASTKVIIKPNVCSWRNITIKNIFETSYNYQRDLDSHMMKNTEWGAVAYLSHSKYGIDKEVNINNNSAYKTGYSSLPSLNQTSIPGMSGDGVNYNLQYNTEIGYLASTTGNISGIYDMSGGSWEYVASYINGKTLNGNINPTNYNSKYFDTYNELSSTNSYQYRILGDATGEMGSFYSFSNVTGYYNSWYSDSSYFVDSHPWFARGGVYYDGLSSGTFAFGRNTGEAISNISFRIVLTP